MGNYVMSNIKFSNEYTDKIFDLKKNTIEVYKDSLDYQKVLQAIASERIEKFKNCDKLTTTIAY